MKPEYQAYIEQYLSQLSEQERNAVPQVTAEHFCADEFNANECARLINQRIKTATCSLKQGYDIDNDPLPEVGRLTLVLNWQQEPVCIVKVTEVSVCPFDQVSEAFAYAEGEGDRSYQWWHKAHLDFFTQYAAEIGADFQQDSELVLERFEKVYPLNSMGINL